MHLLVVTGTHGFPELVNTVIQNLDALGRRYRKVTVQYGRRAPDQAKGPSGFSGTPQLHLIPYYNGSIKDVAGQESDTVVLTHCGTGTVLELLKHRLPFFVVPNRSLSGDHQQEFAECLQLKGACVSHLETVITDLLTKYPPKLALVVQGSLWTELQQA